MRDRWFAQSRGAQVVTPSDRPEASFEDVGDAGGLLGRASSRGVNVLSHIQMEQHHRFRESTLRVCPICLASRLQHTEPGIRK